MQYVSVFWFRRDLRLQDNAGLFHALKSGLPVIPLFIFDKDILDRLEDRSDRRVDFIYRTLTQIHEELSRLGSGLHLYYGKPIDVFKKLTSTFSVQAVYVNSDYEPYAIKRDKEISEFLQSKSIAFNLYKDQVIFEKNEVIKDDGKPYTVFTPYSKKWKSRLNASDFRAFDNQKYFSNFFRQDFKPLPALGFTGITSAAGIFPEMHPAEEVIKRYTEKRDFPGIEGTSKLGVHLRFGTISIRQLAEKALRLNETFLNELIWREFYQMILWHFPNVNKAFKPAYDKIIWRNNETEFEAWCQGQTGYPIVDAGMRELNETGFMHNRVRMITASFLTKHLLIDWRWGESYFAEKLLDFDLAANNGGWQWAAGCGCDAAPYFRIFNPYLQTKKFDPELSYIKKWVPEFQEFNYPKPVVEHELARKRCLEVFKEALKSN